MVSPCRWERCSGPEVRLIEHGYIYLSDGTHDATHRENQRTQADLGAATQILEPGELAERWPFFNLEGITLGSWNPVGEGWFDGSTMFETFRRKAREAGVEYVTGEVVLRTEGGTLTAVAVDTPYQLKNPAAVYAQSADWTPEEAVGFIKLIGQSTTLAGRVRD